MILPSLVKNYCKMCSEGIILLRKTQIYVYTNLKFCETGEVCEFFCKLPCFTAFCNRKGSFTHFKMLETAM